MCVNVMIVNNINSITQMNSASKLNWSIKELISRSFLNPLWAEFIDESEICFSTFYNLSKWNGIQSS